MLTAEQYVRPEVARQIRRLDLRARFIVEGFLAGLHASPSRGFSHEFSEHRRYAPGDDPRRLDWAAWAKTDRLYVREFEAETGLTAHLVLDVSRSMAWAGRPGAMTKLDYATSLLAALAYLLVSQHDAVGLALARGGLARLVAPRSGRRQLVRVLSAMVGARPQAATGLGPALVALDDRVRRRGLFLVAADLVDDLDAAVQGFRQLAFRGHEVVVFHVLDPAERRLDLEGPVTLEDPETGETVEADADAIREAYDARMAAFVDAAEQGVREAGGSYVPMTTETPYDRALVRFLRLRCGQR